MQRSLSASMALNASFVTSFIRIRLLWNVKVSSPFWRRNSAGISVSMVVLELGTIRPTRRFWDIRFLPPKRLLDATGPVAYPLRIMLGRCRRGKGRLAGWPWSLESTNVLETVSGGLLARSRLLDVARQDSGGRHADRNERDRACCTDPAEVCARGQWHGND